MAEIVEALVEGGKASAGPPLGPALGPLGVNIMEIINTINDKTKDFNGMKVYKRENQGNHWNMCFYWCSC